MKKLIVHLGLHKTATTYFQRAVWPQWAGVTYVGKPVPKGFSSPWEAIRELPGQTFLLSSEGLTGSLRQSYAHGGSWLDLCHRNLRSLSDQVTGHYDVRLILSLRSREDWALSIYKHYLKYGGVDDIDEFFGAVGGVPPTCPAESLRIGPRIEAIKDALGVEPLTFYVEELRADPDTLSSRLAAFCGTEMGPTFPRQQFNEGVGTRGKAICLAYNRFMANPRNRRLGYLSNTSSNCFRVLRIARAMGLLQGEAPLKLPAASDELVRESVEQSAQT